MPPKPKGKKQPTIATAGIKKDLKAGKKNTATKKNVEKRLTRSTGLLTNTTTTSTSTDPNSTITTTTTTTMPVTTIPAAASSTTPSPTDPLYFWKPHQPAGYLGQWYPSPWTLNGETYVTAEMWMMVQKARLFNDEKVAKEMLETTDPKMHKALGRMVKGFEEGVWKENRLRIVEEGTYYKFTISKDAEMLRGWLLETGERELVEASPMDRIWGIGFGEGNAGRSRKRWGLNLLGRALMNVRGRLREEGMGKGEGKEVEGKGKTEGEQV